MNFQPKTEKEINDNRLLPKGIYPFEIEEATETTSSKQNEMIVLAVRIINNGSCRILTDYLVPKGVGLEKLLHCCAACGLLDAYKAGSLPGELFVGKQGRLKLNIEKGRKSETGKFPDRNTIEDYLGA